MSGITDALREQMQKDGPGDPLQVLEARLRGEAAPEGQAVAFVPVHPRNGPLWSDAYPAGSAADGRPESYERMPLYTRPQPVAAAGDAVRALVGSWDARAKSEHEKSQDKAWAEWLRDRHHGASGAFSACKLELEAALSADPAAPGRTLYIDLDGVMADFDGAFPAIFGLDHRSLADEEMWSRINSHASFFRDLPPMQGAIDFFRSVEHLQPVILTACPKSNYVHVAGQKRAWVREHLSQTCLVLPVLGGRHKALFMHQAGDVLIDDWGKNCEAWTAAGGIAIKHEGDWIDTRAALSNVMRELSGASAAPSAARDLTGPTVGGATEAGAIVQDGGER